MIDIPGVYVGRFKTDPNNRPALMTRANVPTYTNDNWANVESTGTIWRYSSEAGEWIDTGLEEILVEEVSGTKEIVAEGTVSWKLQGLNVYGKSTQASTTGAQLIDAQAWQTADSEYYKVAKDGGMIQLKADNRGVQAIPIFLALEAGEYTASINSGFVLQIIKDGTDLACVDYYNNYKQTFTLDSPATIGMKVYEYPITNIYPSSIAYPMINSGSTALPWEPYTGGQPSPSPDYPQEIVTAGSDGTIDIAVSDGADQSQQLAINTPNCLPGIPVDSGGNYTDSTGQQWVCDEVDFEKGVYVQRTRKYTYNGTETWFTWGVNNVTEGLTGFYYYLDSNDNNPYNNALNTLLKQNDNTWGGREEGFTCSTSRFPQYIICSLSNDILEDTSSNELAVQSWKNILANKGMTAIFTLIAPIETPLSPEELAAYAALMSYDGSTVISTNEDVSGISAKVVTDVISKNAWFDPYAELALYYKALAGFASLEDLPMPHSRESSLVRKLLDSSYELGFTVTETSSRNERYLWDLINGTTSMLTNVPKSDTEKFLHVMIGGTVEEYPTVDTELDYWMDKCVNYMSSNGSIGE